MSMLLTQYSQGLFRQAGYCIAIATLVTAAGCTTQETRETPSTQAQVTQNADDLLIVDCLLPGRVKKLGSKFVYLSQRRGVKTTTVDCEIRGGEYVAYDRANYATALKIWLPLAKEGQADAQTYVGEIYEKGLGVVPDYSLAAHWYGEAAKQNYSRAQINLGYLYESGLGVERDLVKAMNWYRKASGLENSEGNLEFVSSVEITRRNHIEQQAVNLEKEVAQLQRQLKSKQVSLKKQRKELNAVQKELVKAQRAVPVIGAKTPRPDANPQLQSQNKALLAKIGRLQSQLDETRNERQRMLSRLAKEQLGSEELVVQLNSTSQQLAEKKRLLSDAEAELATTKDQLRKSDQLNKLERQAEIARLRAELAQRESQLDDQKRTIQTLENSISSDQKKVARQMQAVLDQQKQFEAQLNVRTQEVSKLKERLSKEASTSAQTYQLQALLNEAESEQQRLIAKIAREQLLRGDLQNQLDAASARFIAEKQRYAEATVALQKVQSELQVHKQVNAKSGSELSTLRASLSQQQSRIRAQQTEISRLEKKFASGQASLESLVSRSKTQ